MKKLVIFFLLSFNIGMTCIAQMPDTTGTVRPWSNIPGYDFPRIDKDKKAIFRLKALNAAKVQSLFIVIGSMEGQNAKSLSSALTQAGIKNIYYESPGTAHEWHTWRRCLYQFAPLLFK